MDTGELIGIIIVVIGAVSGFFVWHTNGMNKLKEEIKQLELKMKDIERKDDLQQVTLDRLHELYPKIFEFFTRNGGKDDVK